MLKRKGFAVVVAAMLAVLMIQAWSDTKAGEGERLTYPAFLNMVNEGAVTRVHYSEKGSWKAETEDGKTYAVPNPRSDRIKETLLLAGVDVVENEAASWAGLLLFAVIAVLFAARQRSGIQQFALTEAEKAVPDTRFSDVVMSEDVLLAMQDISLYLKKPEQYEKMGARPPRGVLLYGPPGTGKTLLARALAGETGKGFYAVSGSDFVQVYVGVGASRIRTLFKKARKAGGGVIFIDEIDALGKKRDNGNDEREQTLNALLTEMNGFSPAEGIIVLAATNRPETLDGALMREGRFDRRVEIGLPDREGREKLLEIHTKKKKMDASVSLQEWADKTAMFTGAQLESMVNEAAIRAIRTGEERIRPEHMEAAFLFQVAGDARSLIVDEREKWMISVHEAGHALLTHHLLPDSRLTRVTVLPSSKGAAGYSLAVQKERRLYTRQELMCRMAVALGGRAAEEKLLGKDSVTNGAGSDLEKARDLAKEMYVWHMSGEKDAVEAEQCLMAEAMEMAMDCLGKNEGALRNLAAALMKKETLCGDEILQFMA